jgi:hypothetical protein
VGGEEGYCVDRLVYFLCLETNWRYRTNERTMLGSLTWLGLVAAATAQFDFVHTQYDTSPPVYPSRKLRLLGAVVFVSD